MSCFISLLTPSNRMATATSNACSSFSTKSPPCIPLIRCQSSKAVVQMLVSLSFDSHLPFDERHSIMHLNMLWKLMILIVSDVVALRLFDVEQVERWSIYAVRCTLLWTRNIHCDERRVARSQARPWQWTGSQTEALATTATDHVQQKQFHWKISL